MIVHSYLYYVMDMPIVTDDEWQRWANELVELQQRCTHIGFYDKEFYDWDAATGMHLPRDAFAYNAALALIKAEKPETFRQAKSLLDDDPLHSPTNPETPKPQSLEARVLQAWDQHRSTP